MSNIRYYLLVGLIIFFGVGSLYALEGWHLQSSWGASESFNSRLKFNRVNQPDMTFSADWKGRSFIDSWYYAIKVEKWSGQRMRGIEWLHHKIYINNPPAGLGDFSLSDGFNILFYNKGRLTKNNTIQRVGIGLVFGHSDVTFKDGERFYMDGGIGGSYLCGVAAQLSIEKHLYHTKHHYISAEGKLTVAYARPPISTNDNEFAEVPNIAFHFLLSLGSKPVKNPSTKDKLQYFFVPFLHHYSIYIFEPLFT